MRGPPARSTARPAVKIRRLDFFWSAWTGQFLAELSQLSGRPALVDGRAEGEVETLLLPPERLRALLVAEAELGERIMRALILRRVNLLQGGVGGVVLIGPSHSSGVVRL